MDGLIDRLTVERTHERTLPLCHNLSGHHLQLREDAQGLPLGAGGGPPLRLQSDKADQRQILPCARPVSGGCIISIFVAFDVVFASAAPASVFAAACAAAVIAAAAACPAALRVLLLLLLRLLRVLVLVLEIVRVLELLLLC